MKSLPEKDFWKVIKNRLANYKEEPQDDWLKIASVIPSTGTRNPNNNMNLAADLLSATSLAFLMWALSVMSLATHTGAPERLHTPSASSSDKTVPVPADTAKAGTPIQDKARQLHEHAHYGRAAQGYSAKRDESETLRRNAASEEPTDRQRSHGVSQRQLHGDVAGEDDPVTIQLSHKDSNEPGSMQPQSDNVLAGKRNKTDTVFFAVPPILQQKPKLKRKFSPSVYAMIAPSFAYQKVIPVRNDDINVRKLNGAGIVSADRLGFGMEAGFQMQVSRYFELYAALSYYQQHQAVSYAYASATGIAVDGTGTPWSYQLSPDETTRSFGYNMKNAGAGAGILYHIRGRKLMHKLGGGFQYQKGFISSRGEYSYNNAASTYLNYQMMYRMEYSLTGRTSIFLQPQFIHAIIANEDLHEPFDIKPYRAGIGFGLVCHFY
jgi:hypothetical protein